METYGTVDQKRLEKLKEQYEGYILQKEMRLQYVKYDFPLFAHGFP